MRAAKFSLPCDVCLRANAIECEMDGFLNLTKAARGRSTTAQIIGWQVGGSLQRTQLLSGVKRLDSLRFCLSEINDLLHQTRGPDMHRRKAVVKMLGITNAAVRRLMSQQRGGPWLRPALQTATNGQREATNISTADLERFMEKYVTSACLGRELRLNFRAVHRFLQANNVQPIIDPDWLGARVYLRADVNVHQPNLLREPAREVTARSNSEALVEIPSLCAKSSKKEQYRESDGSLQ